MAVRTISRDDVANRTVLVWPKTVGLDDVKTNDNGAHYAKVAGQIVQPAQIPADTFKAAFGFVPLTGSAGRYVMRKAVAPETAEQKITAGIKALVKEVLGDD